MGFAAIAFAEEVLGFKLLPWQKWLLTHALELNPDGSFRFRTVVLLVARQNGKSLVLQILALFFMYVRGSRLVISTAQNLDIAEEVWSDAVDLAESVEDLAAEIKDVSKVNGKKALILTGGERWKVQAANRRGGRGLSGDLVEMDELREHQSWDAWAAVTKTTMARALAMIWAASNAGDARSVVLWHLRLLGHAALGNPDGLDIEATGPVGEASDSLGIFEWSAAPGCDIWDRSGWAAANPSLGHTITERAVEAATLDPEDVFRTEVLCQWVDTLTPPVIAAEVFADCSSRRAAPASGARIAMSVSMPPDRSATAISIASVTADGLPYAELIRHEPGSAWVVEDVVDACEVSRPCAVVLTGAATAFEAKLRDVGIDAVSMTSAQEAQACGMFYDAVATGQFRHRGQHAVTDALAAARKQPVGASWKWRQVDGEDISPLVSMTQAIWAFAEHGDDDAEVSVFGFDDLDDEGDE